MTCFAAKEYHNKKIPTKETNTLRTLIIKAKKSHHLKQTNVLNVVFSWKMKRDSKYTAPQNTDGSKIIGPHPGFWPCKSDSRCDTCRRGHFCTSVESSKNGRKHQIHQPLTCKSKNICYLIHCKHCNQQYTGKTQLEFYLRLNNHTIDIKLNKKSTGMVRHFGDCGVNNMQHVILEKFRSSHLLIRKAREQFYIDLLEIEINSL